MNKLRILAVAGLALLQAATVHAQKTPADVRVVTDKNRASIEAAMPAKLLVPAQKPRRILVLSRSMGYYHRATPLGKVFFENVQKTFKGYSFVLSDDPEDYRPENLTKYDALILNNGTGIHALLKAPETHKGIIQFVQDGGGIMCIHAASDGGWPEYNEMIGSRFGGHPWTSGGTHAFLNEDASHGMTKQFGSAFPLRDEIYVSKDPFFDREKFRVLISMDLSDKETASKPSGKTNRGDRDYSVSHVRAFGKGRVFYTSFGHTDLVYFDNNVLTHYLAGIQYVAGDLEIEDTPIAFYDRLKAHDGPLYYEAKLKLVNMIRYADTPEKKQEVAALCTKLIKDSSATAASRQLATLSALLEKTRTDSQLVSVLNALSKVPDAGVETLVKAYEEHAGAGVADAAKAAVSGSAELMSKVDWVFSSNFNNNPGEHKLMVDLDPKTRWTSRAYMVKSEAMWITVDLGYEQAVTSVVLDSAPSRGDFARKYELYVSNDPDNFGEPAASGNGATLTEITCNATGRYLKIVQTGKEGPFWSIHELKVNARPKKK